MTTTINADTSVGGAIVTGDTSGQLGLQADGTTLLTVAGDAVTFNKGISETIYNLSGTALDPANGTIQTKTLSTGVTLSDSLSSGESLVLMLNGGVTYSVIFPPMTWVTGSGNTAPTLTANDTIVFWKINTTLYGAYVGSYT
mgnify:CR=1 FL=1|jgi:hypothetical protein